MDNLISGLIAAAIFIPFVGGLAVSIGAAPFAIIVMIVVAMMLYDYYESVRDVLRAKKDCSIVAQLRRAGARAW
jgi:4-hydroxybenzoate polyprenyltransferase